MNKPLLSIIIPVAPNRGERLKAILSRLTLNKRLFPDHTFEVVVVDGGSTDETKDLCQWMTNFLSLKYIYVPIYRFINAGYPRNIALRACEGQVIGMIDIDHWPSENLVYGMLNPLIDDSEFTVVNVTPNGDRSWRLIDVVEKMPDLINGQYCVGAVNCLNRGYVIDSSKSHLNFPNDRIPKELLKQDAMSLQILSVYEETKIPFGVNNTLWTWSAQRDPVLALNGYDEIYCRQFAYSREDDDWRERLKAQITGQTQFQPSIGFCDAQNKNFCAIHLWHPAPCRNDPANNLNKNYYPTVCQPVRNIKRNVGWQWGKLLDYSFSLIDGVVRDPKEHEEWIKDNVPDVPNYIDDPAFGDIDVYVEALEEYVK